MVLPLQHGFTHTRDTVERRHGFLNVAGGGALLALFAAGILQAAGTLTNATILGVP